MSVGMGASSFNKPDRVIGIVVRQAATGQFVVALQYGFVAVQHYVRVMQPGATRRVDRFFERRP